MAGRKRAAGGAAKPPSKKRRTSTRRSYRRASAFAPETKYFDTTFAFTAGSGADWTGTEVACSSYIQSDGTTVGAYTDSALVPSAVGSGYGQVVGSKYLVKALRARGELKPTVTSDSADVLAPISVTLALVLDTQPNGAQAQGEEVFTDLGSETQCNYSFQAMGAGSGGRFQILKRKTYLLQPGAAGTDGASTNSLSMQGRQFEFTYQPKKPLLCNIKANSAVPTVASLSDNNIFMLCHRGLGQAVVVNGAARCYYCD